MAQRWGAIAGIIAIGVLVPISVILVGTDYPFADASAEEVSEYFRTHRTAFMVVIVLDLVSIGAFILFALVLRDAFPTTWSLWASTAGVLVALVTGLESVTFAAAGFDGSPEVIRPLWALGHFGFGTLVHVFVASLLAAGSLSLRAMPGWPTWLLVLGGVGTAGNVVVPLGLFGGDVDLLAGTLEHAIGTLPWAVWTVAVAIGLLRRLNVRYTTGEPDIAST